MTDFVTVRRDALRELFWEAYNKRWLTGPSQSFRKADVKIEARLAAMIVSPWREIDDEARNGQLWLISGFVENNPKKDRWVVIARWWPKHECWTSEGDEPPGWEPEFHPPTHYATIPEPPK